MKVVILAGGRGSRLSEETYLKPKPMIEVGNKPILWHIMKTYSKYNFNDFIICLGYKSFMIKQYFANYFLYESDVTIDLQRNTVKIHKTESEPWKVTLVDTDIDTMTGGRIKRIRPYIKDRTFMLTYGDGLADIDFKELLRFHKRHGKLATVTAVKPPGRFGALDLAGKAKVIKFSEKPKGDRAWINGGFFVLEREIFDYIEGDGTYWEREPLRNLAKDGQLQAYIHRGFWKGMDTLRDKEELEQLWNSGNAPWKVGEK